MEKLHHAVLGTVLVVIVMTALEFVRPVSVAGDTPKDMRIVNTSAEPIPTSIQGTVAVSGAVSGTVDAQQKGPWNVGIVGVPTVGIDPLHNLVKIVGQGPQTELLMDDDYHQLPEDTSTFATPIDVSNFAKVRVSATINGSGDITFRIYSGKGASGGNTNLRLIETLTSGSQFTRVYDVPGVSLHISMNPESGNNQALIQVYGH